MNIYRPYRSSLRYYVYAYLRSKDSKTAKAGTPYYVGKGCNDRYKTRHSCPIPKDPECVVLLETMMTELGAFAIERRLIRWFGRKDLGTGILLNRTDGGDGAPNTVSVTTGKSTAKDAITGEIVGSISLTDSRWATGEIVGVMRGISPSIETRKKYSKAHKGQQAWNKGLPGLIGERNGMYQKPAWNRGVPGPEPWNKGKSPPRASCIFCRRQISANNLAAHSATAGCLRHRLK